MDRKTVLFKLQELRERYKKEPGNREIIKRQARCFQIVLDRTYPQTQFTS